MADVFYFDTAIWLDFYEKRGARGKAAKRLIRKIIEEDCLVLYSIMNIRELKKLGFFTSQIQNILSILKPDGIKFIQVSKSQIDECTKISSQRGVSKGDVLHAILARDNEANLITRDLDFKKLKDISIPRLPEEFI